MRVGGDRRWWAAGAAAAVAAVVAATLLLSRHGSPRVDAAPTAAVGGFPTGLAIAAQSVYVASGSAGALSVLPVSTCNATQQAGCRARSVSTRGRDAIGVAVNKTTHTLYAVDGGSDSVAVFDTRTCNARRRLGCGRPLGMVHVAGSPEFAAVDEGTNTVYVAATSDDTVAVIDGAACDAARTDGCGETPARVRVGQGAFPIVIDERTHTVYVGTFDRAIPRNGRAGSVYVVDGRRCDGRTHSGCGVRPPRFPVPAGPSGLVLDPRTRTLYVSSETGRITVVSTATCNSLVQRGCEGSHPAVTVGVDPRGAAIDPASGTLYVAVAGTNVVSMFDTHACNAADTGGCTRPVISFPVGTSPRRVAFDAATHTLYVANAFDDSVSMVDTARCNVRHRSGCAVESPSAARSNGTHVP